MEDGPTHCHGLNVETFMIDHIANRYTLRFCYWPFQTVYYLFSSSCFLKKKLFSIVIKEEHSLTFLKPFLLKYVQCNVFTPFSFSFFLKGC